MELAESILLTIAVVAMAGTLLLSIIPFIPGPVVMWAIGIVFAALTGFQRVTPAAAVIMTLLMIVGSTTEFWMPVLGIQSKGMSCLSVIGGFFGSIFGTVVIPIPIVGTITGAVAGSLLVELVRAGELRQALRAGRGAFQLYLVGFVAELITCIAIFATFLISVASTG